MVFISFPCHGEADNNNERCPCREGIERRDGFNWLENRNNEKIDVRVSLKLYHQADRKEIYSCVFGSLDEVRSEQLGWIYCLRSNLYFSTIILMCTIRCSPLLRLTMYISWLCYWRIHIIVLYRALGLQDAMSYLSLRDCRDIWNRWRFLRLLVWRTGVLRENERVNIL